MKTIKWIIFASFLCFWSCGLPYCKKTHLSDEELKWITMYDVNDTILFHDNEIVDTMVVTNIEIDNKSYISIFDFKSCNWLEGQHEYNANATVTFEIKHGEETLKGRFTIFKVSEGLIGYLKLGNLIPVNCKYINIDNKDVIVLKKDVNAEPITINSIKDIKEVRWDKNGLTSFVIESNQIFKKKVDGK